MEPIKTIGQLLKGETRRDAIHIAIAPVIAGQELRPGESIDISTDGLAWAPGDGMKAIGIVDPFLAFSVQEGEQFWLWLTPNTITSLRHVWSHPAFDTPPALREYLERQAGNAS